MSNRLSEEELEDCRNLFSIFDKDGDGRISLSELQYVMESLNIKLTLDEIKIEFKNFDTDHSGKIEFDEFIEFYKKYMSSNDNSETELLEAFKSFDIDGNGYISKNEFRNIMTQLGEKLTEEEFEDLLKEADIDHDGRINYNEFVKVMTS